MGERLDVVDERRAAEVAELRRERGLSRGIARLPSIDSSIAVSSPAI